YNPYNEPREVTIKVPAPVGGVVDPARTASATPSTAASARSDLYEAVANDFVARDVEGSAPITIPPDAARVIVMAPAGAKITYDGMHTLADGVVIDYDNGRVARPVPAPRTTPPDLSRVVYADRATIQI